MFSAHAPIMGHVIQFHARNPKAARSTRRPRSLSARSNLSKYLEGTEPRATQPHTVEGFVPAHLAIAAGPPIISITSAGVLSMPQRSAQFAKLSILRKKGMVNSHFPMYTEEMARILRYKHIGGRLKSLQEMLGIVRQKDMALLAGVEEGNYSQFISGERRISLNAAERLRSATGVTLDWIYYADTKGLRQDVARKLHNPVT